MSEPPDPAGRNFPIFTYKWESRSRREDQGIAKKGYGQPVVELVNCCGAGAREKTSSRRRFANSVGRQRSEASNRHEISRMTGFAEQRKRDRLGDGRWVARHGARDRLVTGRPRGISSSFRVSVVFRPFLPT
jgi:hypothetical protein